MEERGGRMKEREGGRKAGKCVSLDDCARNTSSSLLY